MMNELRGNIVDKALFRNILRTLKSINAKLAIISEEYEKENINVTIDGTGMDATQFVELVNEVYSKNPNNVSLVNIPKV